jgi:hypothetical protein
MAATDQSAKEFGKCEVGEGRSGRGSNQSATDPRPESDCTSLLTVDLEAGAEDRVGIIGRSERAQSSGGCAIDPKPGNSRRRTLVYHQPPKLQKWKVFLSGLTLPSEIVRFEE